MGGSNSVVLVALVIAGLLLMLVMHLVGQHLSLFIQARLAGAPVGLLDLIGMRLRKVDVRLVVLLRIRAVKAGFDISTAQLESHYLAGGRVADVVDALVGGRAMGLALEWDRLRALDLAGHDVRALVEQCAQEAAGAGIQG